MPVEIVRRKDGFFSVVEVAAPFRVFAKKTTLAKAQAQKRLLDKGLPKRTVSRKGGIGIFDNPLWNSMMTVQNEMGEALGEVNRLKSQLGIKQ